MSRGVSRTRWCAQTLFGLTPFLQPLHALAAVAQRTGRPVTLGVLHRAVASLVLRSLEVPQDVPLEFFEKVSGFAASDASATEERAVLGGYFAPGERSTKSTAHWFSIRLDRSEHPWVWARANDPKRVIAALELLSIVVLTHLVARRKPNTYVNV